ncbi:hypothetical protein BDA99DRAFT_539438 [Phascolomyces articulosus]|uniref:Uncharacterized protein n=1 Tax=Phascolomyces articulosus TaxID=60185 RepID=A0AAD5PBU7_9FUNG|nr:hypothetical protein BDA99DRAFT_539438 [Phascolomyces articulosus]
MFRRINIARRFGTIPTTRNTRNIVHTRHFALSGSQYNKNDKETIDYLEKMMDEEEKSQKSSEKVEQDYWKDPGSVHDHEHEHHHQQQQQQQQQHSKKPDETK